MCSLSFNGAISKPHIQLSRTQTNGSAGKNRSPLTRGEVPVEVKEEERAAPVPGDMSVAGHPAASARARPAPVLHRPRTSVTGRFEPVGSKRTGRSRPLPGRNRPNDCRPTYSGRTSLGASNGRCRSSLSSSLSVRPTGLSLNRPDGRCSTVMRRLLPVAASPRTHGL